MSLGKIIGISLEYVSRMDECGSFGMIVILVSILVASGKISQTNTGLGESTELNQTWVYVTALLLSLSSRTEKC